MQRLLAASIVVVTACDRGETRTPPPLPPAAIAGPAAPAAPDGVKRIDPRQDVRGLIGRLEYEAAHRPRAGVTAEQVFDALDRAGIALRQRRQYLGAIANAAYCAGGTTPDGIAISICEYADGNAARDGKRLMDERFAAMTKHATRAVRGATVMTIVPPDAVAQAEITARARHALDEL